MSASILIERDGAVNNSIDALIDEREFARITGRSVASARRDRGLRTGCPYVKLGSLVRYRLADVREYIARNVHGVVHE
jgi:predicted DNA-binding transcriptional regulator AlpA